MIATLISLLTAAATLAFGAVYPWGYLPLFAGAALIGFSGAFRRPRVFANAGLVAISLLLLTLAVSVQLVPLSADSLKAISSRAPDILGNYSLSFIAANSAHPTSIEPAATKMALVALVSLGLYLLGAPGTLSRDALRALPRNLTLFAVPLAVFGIVSRERSNGLIYWFWQPERGGGGNGFGPFINRNHFAGWMLMAACLAIGLLFGQLERARQDSQWNWRNRTLWLSSPEANKIILTAMSIGVMAISLVWTMSRSGIISFAVALGCFVWFIARRQHVDRSRRTVALICLGLILVGGVTWRGPNLLLNWFQDTRDLTGRFAAWKDGWRVVEDFPVVGTGLNTYSTAMIFYQTTNSGAHLAQAHNDYLQLLAEGGLLVTPLAAAAVVCLIVAVRRNLKAAQHESRGYWIRAGAAVGLIGIGVQEAVDFSLQIPANAFLFCTLAAIAMAPVENQASPQASKRQQVVDS